MNPKDGLLSDYTRGFVMVQPEGTSEFEIDLENAKPYFGDDFPGNEGLTCLKCGAAVNLGWRHIEWHESSPS